MYNPTSLRIRGKKIGALLKDARIASGKSMTNCANTIGVTSERISAFERGEKQPSLPELEALSFFMDIPLSHFWGTKSLLIEEENKLASTNLGEWVTQRTRIIGEKLKLAREKANITLKELSETVGITPRKLKSYENGKIPVPLPELETMLNYMNVPINEFWETEGVVGFQLGQLKVVDQFVNLPRDLQDFVTKPVNIPYIEVAQRLSTLSVDQLRGVAESILEITL
jgi:transcriptional regulator with XRE-family HTH domain